jgi:hypothetical protein
VPPLVAAVAAGGVMMRALLIVLAVLVSFGAVCAQAQATGAFFEGNELHKLCTSNRSSAVGYILGVSDAHDLFVERGGVSASICMPEGIQRGQAVDVACKYLADNPQDRHLQGASLVIFAFEAAFPCRR